MIGDGDTAWIFVAMAPLLGVIILAVIIVVVWRWARGR
jgi:hypothetical protein